MKLNKINFLFIFVAVLTIIALGLRPSIFQKSIENNINKRWANPRGWTFSVGEMNGHLLKTFIMKDIRFLKENGNKLDFNTIAFNLSLSSLLSGNISFDEVAIDGCEIIFNINESEKNILDNSFNLRPIPISIHNLSFNGRIPITINQQKDKIDLTLNAELDYLDNATRLNVDELYIDNSDILGFPLGLIKAAGLLLAFTGC